MGSELLNVLKRLGRCIWLIPVAVFFAAVLFTPQNKLAIVINGLDIGAWIFILRGYFPPFWRLFKRKSDSPELFFFGGVLMFSTGVALSRIWSLGIILAGKPAWMINHWFQSFCYLIVALGLFYLLRIPGSGRSGKYIAGAITIAVMVVAVFLTFWE